MKIIKNLTRATLSLLLLTTFYLLLVTTTKAVNMNSNQYRIQFGTINIGGQKMSDPVNNLYNLTTSLGQTAAGEFDSNGYIVRAGFQYIYSRIPFIFSLSSIRADLGTLMPSTPSPPVSINIRVSFGGAGQYIVTAAEKGPLKNFSNIPIPNTSCNGGINTCSTTLAKPWTLSSAYGFGYNMTGQDIPADFINSTYYRPFADITTDSPAPIMQSVNVTQNLTPTPNPQYTPAPALTGIPRDTTHQSTMTFMANISPLQAAGSYFTMIQFVAVPSF